MLYKKLVSLSTQALVVFSNPLYLGATPPLNDQKTPFSAPYAWKAGHVSEFTIHNSCNAAQKEQLQSGLSDAVTIAKHAKEHILIRGTESPIYKKYFGKGPTGAVLGWFDKIATANRRGIIFRCDDPDRNCQTQNRKWLISSDLKQYNIDFISLPLEWAGHHRGQNASMETVICEISFLTRLPLEDLCTRSFDVATGKPNKFWGLDLMHRLYHLDKVGEGVIKHHTHGQQEALELASGDDYILAATNTDSLILFASEAYAFDIINPGIGCPRVKPRRFQNDSH